MTEQPTDHGGEEAPPHTGRIKGTLLIARMKFLRGQGKIPVEAVLQKLSAADQAVLQGILLPSTWYPADLLMRLEVAIAAVIARGDRARAFAEMGRFAAQANLGPGGVQRPYIRDGNPHHVLERLPRMYLSQHTTGHRTYERVDTHCAIIRTHDGEGALPDDCQMILGWLQRAIELSGGADVQVTETECRARGASCCAFRAEWA